MAALTADKKQKMKSVLRTYTAKVAASTKLYAGALVSKNAAGFAIPAADAAATKVIGVAQGLADNSTGANGAIEVLLAAGVAFFKNEGTALVDQAAMHSLCYVQDDQTVRKTGGTNSIVAGIVDQVDSDGVYVNVQPETGATAN